jgi:methyl-accepting chemotaxis protein
LPLRPDVDVGDAPIEQLSHTALRVSRGDLTARVPGRQGKDELVVLAHVFNEMVQAIQGQTAQLETEVKEPHRAAEQHEPGARARETRSSPRQTNSSSSSRTPTR